MKKLGIIGAMTIEIEALRSKMTNLTTRNVAGMSFYEGKLDGLPVAVVVCGVGKVNAAMCVQVLCDNFGVTHIVNTGVAGSLCAQLDIGDLVIGQEAMYHDFDCSALSYPIGQVPGLSTHTFEADKELVNLAFIAAQKIHEGHVKIGRIASGDQFVSGKEKKEEIIANTRALCTEMEGAAIAHAAWKNGVPFVIIRAISDKADDSAQMDYPTFETIAANRCAAVTCTLTKELKSRS